LRKAALDSKSSDRKIVWVRATPPANPPFSEVKQPQKRLDFPLKSKTAEMKENACFSAKVVLHCPAILAARHDEVLREDKKNLLPA
jgi:hypothetical protein